MTPDLPHSRSRAASVVFDVLDPIPFGFFVAALIFDAVYADSAEMLWVQGAAWLIAIGLLFAIVPRLINLARVWVFERGHRMGSEVAGFWLYLVAIVAAIVNAFVHSRDAYGVMPAGLWLSCLTVASLVLAKAMPALLPVRARVAS